MFPLGFEQARFIFLKYLHLEAAVQKSKCMWDATDWLTDFAGQDPVLSTVFVLAVAMEEGNLINATKESR